MSTLRSQIIVAKRYGLTAVFITLLNIASAWAQASCLVGDNVDWSWAEHHGKKFSQADVQQIVQSFAKRLAESVSNRGDSERLDFVCANLRGIHWTRVEPRSALLRADFTAADLTHSDFFGLNLQGVKFDAAKLNDVEFLAAKLQHASFDAADFNGADLRQAVLDGANFSYAKVGGAIFEPQLGNASSGSASYERSMRIAFGLADMTFRSSPDALTELRASFRKIGRRDLERRITHAIEASTTSKFLRDGEWLEGYARYIFLEIPTGYDLQPMRALAFIVVLIGVFSIPYTWSLMRWTNPKIWLVLPANRLNGDGKEAFEPLKVSGFERFKYGFLFSVFSAFQLGWRDLNVGSWLSRLQGTEYALRGQGWVRTLSGFQSLLSVYFLAIWALTQFGRLFDS